MALLAGLTRKEESTATEGLPGTTGDLFSIKTLQGGADKMLSKLLETLTFMAPTVIDPSADNQSHWAFKR